MQLLNYAPQRCSHHKPQIIKAYNDALARKEQEGAQAAGIAHPGDPAVNLNLDGAFTAAT